MKKINVILSFLVSVLLFSCSDDFIDETTEFQIDSENFFNSETDYYEALIAAYDLLQATYINVLIGEIASDNTLAGGESPTDTPGIQQIDDMIHTPVNDNLKNVWDWMFAGVNRANYILEFQNKTEFEGRDQIIAEARFLRAYYNFELVKWFGGIPLKENERFSVGDELVIPRSSEEEVYNLIQEDLIFASANLAEVAPEIGRVARGAALALLGKAYLYDEKYALATEVLDEVIGSNQFQLETNYDLIFEPEGENGIGSVFEIQYTDVEGAGFGCLQCSEGNVAVGFNGIRNYSGTLFDSGFSFNVPTQEVVDSFEDGDIRFSTAILDIDAWAEQTGATFTEGNEHTGFYNRKYIARQGDLNTGDQNLTNPNNYRAIRFADVLLMAAEAHVESPSGNGALAQTYLNRVRDRAGLEAVSSTGTDLLNAIYQERRVELVGEGHHFFDLVRTGRAANEIDGFEFPKNNLFPIPFEEIQFANGNWEQNEGYN